MFGGSEKLVTFQCGKCGIKSLLPEKTAPYIRFFENVNGELRLAGCICRSCWRNLQNAMFKGGEVDV